MEEKFDICVDDDCVDIMDWINEHFQNGNWHKHFEVTVKLKEINFDEEGEKFYVQDEKDEESKTPIG